MRVFVFVLMLFVCSFICCQIPIYFWHNGKFVNFGDYISYKLVERIVGIKVSIAAQKSSKKKLLAIGSIMAKAENNDIIWGSGVSGKRLKKSDYNFSNLDIRAVRGPLTHKFLLENFNIESPQVYGDPALLLPYFFPELKKKENPRYEFIIIPHYTEQKLFPKSKYSNVIYPTEPWYKVIEMILNSKFVISSSLHGIIVAEAYGIPARMLRITKNEPLFKYQDYYLGTGRPDFKFATSIKEALLMGGEPAFKCNLKALYKAFPFDAWSNVNVKEVQFESIP